MQSFPFLHVLLQLSAAQFSSDAQTLSAIAVMIGAIFVYFQLRQNNKLIRATSQQAEAAITQAKLTTVQTKQNNEIANMDLLMRLYEFANTTEVQTSWLTVLHSGINSEEDFQKLPKEDQVAFYQIAALFESLGVLVKRGFVELSVIDETFQTELAWQKLNAFTKSMRNKFGEEAGYSSFESLYEKIKMLNSSSPQT